VEVNEIVGVGVRVVVAEEAGEGVLEGDCVIVGERDTVIVGWMVWDFGTRWRISEEIFVGVVSGVQATTKSKPPIMIENNLFEEIMVSSVNENMFYFTVYHLLSFVTSDDDMICGSYYHMIY
jgi:hypothetical protein